MAQMAERRTRNAQVPGSIPGSGLKAALRVHEVYARMAQMAELYNAA